MIWVISCIAVGVITTVVAGRVLVRIEKPQNVTDLALCACFGLMIGAFWPLTLSVLGVMWLIRPREAAGRD